MGKGVAIGLVLGVLIGWVAAVVVIQGGALSGSTTPGTTLAKRPGPAEGPPLTGRKGLPLRPPGPDGTAEASARHRLPGRDPDPWVREGEPVAGTPVAPAPRSHGPYPAIRLSPTGGLVPATAKWTDTPIGDGFELAAYDVAALAPLTDAWLPALLGLEVGAPVSGSASAGWCARLAEALVDAVGRDRWADPALLAWDARRTTLFVRHDADGHACIAEELTRRAGERLGSIRLDAVVRDVGSEPASTLTVDVPWGPAVRAHRGTSWSYLGDYEIECSALHPLYPWIDTVDTGFGVSAKRVVEANGTELLEVEVASASARPDIVPFTITAEALAVEVPLETARIEALRWRGRIPTSPGRHVVHLDDGRPVTLLVHAERRGPALKTPFLRHPLPRPAADDATPATRGPTRVVASWMASDSHRGAKIEIPLFTHGEPPDGLRSEGTLTVNRHGQSLDPKKRECRWPLAEGGARIRVSVLVAGDVDVLDLVVERSDASIEKRTTPCHRHEYVDQVPLSWTEPLVLPVCPVRVDTRRIQIPVGGQVVVRLDDAPGGVLQIAVPRKN